jgi:hypothetical protein
MTALSLLSRADRSFLLCRERESEPRPWLEPTREGVES